MAPKYLQTEEMLQITSTWLDPQSTAHAGIAAIAELSAKLPRAADAHLAVAAAAQPAKNPRIGETAHRKARSICATTPSFAAPV